MNKLFCFGFGYSARRFASLCTNKGWHVVGTSRTPSGVRAVNDLGFTGVLFDGEAASPGVRAALTQATHILVSAAPDATGDPVLRHHAEDLAACQSITWIGYLSTVGVYGDYGGAWVDEETEPRPKSERSKRRLQAEQAWQTFAEVHGCSLQIFRLSGIYGPGRSAIDKLREGKARRLVKPGQVFNRIHVDDIAQVLDAAAHAPGRNGIFNLTDDLPAPPQDVVSYAAELLGLAPPPEIDFETADLSPMARSFYSENKRVSNAKLKAAFALELIFPTYREGIAAIAADK